MVTIPSSADVTGAVALVAHTVIVARIWWVWATTDGFGRQGWPVSLAEVVFTVSVVAALRRGALRLR
jgi:hypothetical protein